MVYCFSTCHKLPPSLSVCVCVCAGQKQWPCIQSTSAFRAVQSGCDYICPPLLPPLASFSLLRGDSGVKSWTAAKRGRPRHAAETFTSRAGRDAGSDRRREGGGEKSERNVSASSFPFVSCCSPSPSPRCLSQFLFFLPRRSHTVFARLRWQGVTVGLEDGTEGEGGGRLWVQRVQLRREINA